MTETTVDLRAAKTMVICPHHPDRSTMVSRATVRHMPQAKVSRAWAGMEWKVPSELVDWFLADGCIVTALDYKLVPDDMNRSHFEPIPVVPKIRTCPECGRLVDVHQLGDALILGSHRRYFDGQNVGPTCPLGGSLIREGATLTPTETKEDEMTNTSEQTELRTKLASARAAAAMNAKIVAAGAIVTTLDGLPDKSIIRFDKAYAATGSKPAGSYTYVAIKTTNAGVWYTTGSETGPYTSDDLAAFMLAGVPVTVYQLLGDASAEFDIALNTPADVSSVTADETASA